MDRIGIERLCTFGMPPLAFVALAADLDCRHIGMSLTPMRRSNPHDYPDWSLRDDAGLRHDMVAAMRDRSVSMSLCEGFGVWLDQDVRAQAGDLDIVRELGGTRINIGSTDRDTKRALDGFAMLAEMAGERGIETVAELGMAPVSSLKDAFAAVEHVGRPDFRILIDTMHYFRRGGTVADLAACDLSKIGYVQLCDVPWVSNHARYMDEALYERLPPGDGELPLGDLLAVVPRDVIVSVEVPQRSLAEAGVGPRERIGRCVEAARRLRG